MALCCDNACCKSVTTDADSLTIALTGNPNSGKTTLFNALTGLRQKVGNYPGVTVERKVGKCRLPNGTPANVIDLPGTYSLVSRSPDETVAMEVLRGLRADTPAPDVVVVVVDASNLQRNLYLVSQLIELGHPLVVALNMVDVAQRRGIFVSAEGLSRALGVPVVPVVGHKREGIAQLKQAVLHAAIAPIPEWPLPQTMKQEVHSLAHALTCLGLFSPASTHSTRHRHSDSAILATEQHHRYETMAERLLIGDHARDLADIRLDRTISAHMTAAENRFQQDGFDPVEADIHGHYQWIETVAEQCQQANTPATQLAIDKENAALPATDGEIAVHVPLSERVDAVLLHRVWGLIFFAVTMTAMFVAIFYLASPIQDVLNNMLQSMGQRVADWLTSGPLASLIRDGIFAGVGSVVAFIPQIAILFMCLAILEDSGYLARAAFLMDRLLAKVGLHGKSFVPLLSCYACAIPGIMATRTIESRKDRLITMLIAPFMTCSARLPIYSLLVGTLFRSYGLLAQAGIMTGLYLGAIAVAAAIAWLFRRTLLKGPAQAFVLELPTYKLPQASLVARHVWNNSTKFLAKAGTTIFAMSIVLWAIAYYPRMPEQRVQAIQHSAATQRLDDKATQNLLDASQREYSIAGRVGHILEPAIRPLGMDWKMGVGCLGAFAAREVFVSTMAIVYGAGDVEDSTSSLSSAMTADHYPDGRPVWTPLVGVSVLVWFMLAMQCMSTVMVVKQETNSWRWPAFILLYMNALAYVACLLIYQIGSVFLRH